MAKSYKIQVAVVMLSLVVFLGVFLAPKNYSAAKIQEKFVAESRMDMRKQIDEIKGTLKPEEASTVNSLEATYAQASGTEKIQWLDSIITFWDKQMRPAVAAIYAEEKADITQDIDDRIVSGNRYLDMAAFLKPEDKAWAYSEAREAFEKVLEKQPDNADAKISLGICVVETNPESPMEGIALIREVVEKDSTNTRAILQLGHFSVFSGQFSNALKRYEQALRINPELEEAYFFIGDTYAKMDDLANAEVYLNRYKDLQENEAVKKQVESYIEEIKNNVKH